MKTFILIAKHAKYRNDISIENKFNYVYQALIIWENSK